MCSGIAERLLDLHSAPIQLKVYAVPPFAVDIPQLRVALLLAQRASFVPMSECGLDPVTRCIARPREPIRAL